MNPTSEQTGRGTALTTAVLSFVCAGFSGVLSAIYLFTRVLLEAFDPSSEERLSIWAPTGVFAAIAAVVAVAFTVGAVQLLRHRPSGRATIMACSAVFAGWSVYALVSGGADTSLLFLSAVPVLTLVFALLPGTKRWCRP